MALREGQRLVASGPYAIIRHPIYASMIVAFWAEALRVGAAPAIIGAVCAAAAWSWRAVLEDRMLAARLDGAAEYQRRVGGLFPKLRA